MKTLKIMLSQDIVLECSADNTCCKITLSSERIIIDLNDLKICQLADTIEVNNNTVTFNADELKYEVRQEMIFNCGGNEIFLAPNNLSFNAQNIELKFENDLNIQANYKVNFN